MVRTQHEILQRDKQRNPAISLLRWLSNRAVTDRVRGRKYAHRLNGFDYRQPYYYMVTLKRLDNLAGLSQISDEAEPPKGAKKGGATGSRFH